MWPDVMAWCSASRFSPSRRSSRELRSLISRPRVSTRISSSRRARSRSSSCRRTSRSSRFIESGPSARCLPPVTVTLWKHSPACERKNASGFSSARPRATFGFWDDVTVAQLGQNHFQRFAETVEHANRVLQRDDLRGGRSAVRGFVENEGELRLRVFGMDQESRAAVDAGAQHAQAFVGCVP